MAYAAWVPAYATRGIRHLRYRRKPPVAYAAWYRRKSPVAYATWVPAYATRGVRHLGVAYAGPPYPVMCVAAQQLPDYATTRRRNDLGRAI